MEKNIFEGAKFGDKFVTRDGRKVIFVFYLDDIDAYHCILEDWYGIADYAPDGKLFEADNHPTDIISRYQEPIDEEKLCLYKCYYASEYFPIGNEGGDSEIASIRRCSFFDGFDVGYRKAKEE